MFFPITLLLALGTVLQASAMPTTAALAARDDDDVAIMFGRSINNDSIVWAHHNGSCSAFFLASVRFRLPLAHSILKVPPGGHQPMRSHAAVHDQRARARRCPRAELRRVHKRVRRLGQA